jgi:hypothetical protein
MLLAAPAMAQTRSITLGWTAPGDDGWIGQARQYDMRFSRFPITESNFGFAARLNTSILPGPTGSIERLTIFGLTPGVAYYFAVRTADDAGNWSRVSNVAYVGADVAGVDGAIAAEPQFAPPRPNPSGQRASFAVTLPRPEWLRVEAFDITGRKVKTLALGEYSAGSFDLDWDLRDDGGRLLEAGNYLVRGQMGENVFLRRLAVVH